MPERPTSRARSARSARWGPTRGQDPTRSFVLEYQDPAGRTRLRLVTVWDVKPGPDGVPRLFGLCHETGAPRSFRLDRIKAIMDLDGVVLEPLADVFRDLFGIEQPIPQPRDDALGQDRARWTLIRKVAREGGLVLLAAMAAADHDVSKREIDLILDHLVRYCAAQNIALSGAERSRLAATIRTMRPSEEAVARAMAELGGAEQPVVAAILATLAAIADADDFRHPREVVLLDRITFGLTGRHTLPV
jgi:Tellurite resistance protein TerB